MTKRQIIEDLQGDWLCKISGCRVEQAITYLQTLPHQAVLDISWHGYDGADGEISMAREETDEEYSHRLQCEMEALEAARKKAEKKRLDDQKNIDEVVAQLQAKMDALLRVRPE